nr:integrase, catalytic region, zinc finger, CCHC-type, peptidase aspartic, catalytic [Tanacetum cinerariifolium]
GPDNAFDDDVDEQPVQDLALNVDNVFQTENYDAFESELDEAPTAQTMFMANLSLADLITDEVGPSYDSDILSEVQDHDQYLDDTYAYQEEHAMHDSVQLDHIVDLHADYTSVSNMIPYNQYVKDNDMSVVHSNASSVLNDTFMMIYDDMLSLPCTMVMKSSKTIIHGPKSNDLMKLKSEALKERAKVSRPIKVFTVYPPNTPATLFPRVLSTTSQVKIHIFTLIQLFSEFDKTCKKGITPSTITDGNGVLNKPRDVTSKSTLRNYWSMRLALVLKAPNNKLNSLPTLLLLGRRVKRYPKASGSQPKSNHKTNRISPTKGANKLPVEDLPRTNKSHPRTTNRFDSSSRLTRTVINSNSDSICQTCNRCLTSFDHEICVAVYVKSVVLPNSTRHNCEVERKIHKVYYVEGLGYNLFSVGQFCDSDLEVALRKHSCYVRDTDGVDLIKGSR